MSNIILYAAVFFLVAWSQSSIVGAFVLTIVGFCMVGSVFFFFYVVGVPTKYMYALGALCGLTFLIGVWLNTRE